MSHILYIRLYIITVLGVDLLVNVVIWVFFILKNTNLLLVFFVLPLFTVFLTRKINRLRYHRWRLLLIIFVLGLLLY